MKDKWLMIGVGATFVSFFLMIVSMMILSRQTAKNKELLANIPSAPQETAASVTSDFSIYKTIVGDDGRAMTEIPEGPSLPVRRPLQRSEEHTSELQSPVHLVCRLLLEKKKKT